MIRGCLVTEAIESQGKTGGTLVVSELCNPKHIEDSADGSQSPGVRTLERLIAKRPFSPAPPNMLRKIENWLVGDLGNYEPSFLRHGGAAWW